jgi:hypothetical protein
MLLIAACIGLPERRSNTQANSIFRRAQTFFAVRRLDFSG